MGVTSILLLFFILYFRLINKSSASMGQVEGPEDQNEDPASLAEICIRELVNRAGFNNIAAILYPLLKLVFFSLWLPLFLLM